MDPKTIVQDIEQNGSVPAGIEGRFAGYAVIGLPFASGYVLSLRLFPASSVRPGYTSVWHRDPRRMLDSLLDSRPEHGCARYFTTRLKKKWLCRSISNGWVWRSFS
jgi:hypothetical protein